jgi:hypothetical protein
VHGDLSFSSIISLSDYRSHPLEAGVNRKDAMDGGCEPLFVTFMSTCRLPRVADIRAKNGGEQPESVLLTS